MTKREPKYTQEFRQDAIALAERTSNREASEELSVPLPTMNSWIKKFKDAMQTEETPRNEMGRPASRDRKRSSSEEIEYLSQQFNHMMDRLNEANRIINTLKKALAYCLTSE